MTVNVEKVSIGVADATFKGQDLGASKGGVQVEITTNTYAVTVDQTGDSPLKDIITVTTGVVTVPMAETDLDRLKTMLPQSVATLAAAAPTGRTAAAVGAVGATTITLTGTGGGALAVGQTLKFASHTTKYRVSVVNSTTSIDIVQADSGVPGLVAPIASSEAITFTAKTAGVEIRSGVNTDLLDFAGLLVLTPSDNAVNPSPDDVFTAYRAAPVPTFSFMYMYNQEKVYSVKFNCYPDPTNANRIAAFGGAA